MKMSCIKISRFKFFSKSLGEYNLAKIKCYIFTQFLKLNLHDVVSCIKKGKSSDFLKGFCIDVMIPVKVLYPTFTHMLRAPLSEPQSS